MSNLIYPFEINCKSINSYLQVIKNCFRLIEKNSLHLKVNGLFVSLKYSAVTKYYSININKKDYCLKSKSTNCLNEKYKKTIELFKNLLNEKKFLNALKDLKLNKFLNRYLTFIFLDDLVYPISLNIKTTIDDKSLLVLDDLYFYFKDLEKIKSTNLNLDIKEKYSELYKIFWEQLKVKSILNHNKNKTIDNLSNLSLNTNFNKISFKKFQIIHDSGLSIANKDMFYYLVYLITISFNHFLNRHFGLNNVDLMFFDKESNRIIKIPYRMSNISNTETINKDFLAPLMPVRF